MWVFLKEIGHCSVNNAYGTFTCTICCNWSTLGLKTCGERPDGKGSGTWAWIWAGKNWVLVLELL
eukprot:15366978-Ditylum_brightwellii.AAC.1